MNNNTIGYEGANAKAIYDSIVSNTIEAEKEYNKAVSAWENVKEYMKITGLDAQIDAVSANYSNELVNIKESLESMEENIFAVDQSWESTVSTIVSTVETYAKQDDGEK